MTQTVVVFQSGQKVEETAWYEAIGVTRPLVPVADAFIRLESGAVFPDWRGRAVCWRLYSVELEIPPPVERRDIPPGTDS